MKGTLLTDCEGCLVSSKGFRVAVGWLAKMMT